MPYTHTHIHARRLFADLFQSDIIVASPLALATKLAEDKRRAAGKVGRRGEGGNANVGQGSTDQAH